MEIKKEDFVRFHIVNTVFYALPVSFFADKKKEAQDKIDAEKMALELLAEKLRVDEEAKEEKKAKELAEKQRVAEEKAKKEADAIAEKERIAEEGARLQLEQQEKEAKAKAAEEKKAEELRLKKEADLKTKKKAELEAQLADLEE